MEIAMDENPKMKNIITKHDIASSKQKFQSDDSEGSDLSYESSVTDDDDSNIGRIEFFKEEMARFFINYPELINKNILHNDSEEEIQPLGEGEKGSMNRNWMAIADQIFCEAKDPSTTLQALAKRISLYRYKLDQEDIIDLLLQDKTAILKEIQIEMAHKKNEKNLMGQNQKHSDQGEKQFSQDNLYYSWRKRKQLEFKMSGNKKTIKRSESVAPKEKENIQSRTKIVQTFHRSLHKSQSENQLNKQNKFKSQSIKASHPTTGFQRSPTKRTVQGEREETRLIDEPQISTLGAERPAANWRHLVNFQPQTQIGKQLCEDIKKKNNPSDQLGIKKTIIQFLVSYKQLINNEVINKVTLSQKIQKLYTEEAKELLMFYPSKIGSYDSTASTSCNNFKDNVVEDKFVDLLKNIADGPLIKYWRELQQSRI